MRADERVVVEKLGSTLEALQHHPEWPKGYFIVDYTIFAPLSLDDSPIIKVRVHFTKSPRSNISTLTKTFLILPMGVVGVKSEIAQVS